MPFWTELVVKVGNWEVRVSQLQEEVATLTSQLETRNSQLASIRAEALKPNSLGSSAVLAEAVSMTANELNEQVSTSEWSEMLLRDLTAAGYAIVPVSSTDALENDPRNSSTDGAFPTSNDDQNGTSDTFQRLDMSPRP